MVSRGAVSRSNADGEALIGFAGSSEQRYAIDRKIASGGIATVYRGRGLGALGFERPVAIKVCHPHLVDGPGRMNAFLDEARVAARIQHPNVVATLDVVVRDGSVMIVMEYVEGLTVAGLIRAAGRADAPVPIGVAARIVSDALAGLHAAHELRDDAGELLGVVHRDVSPQNILVGVDGFAKLADFGVFKGGERLAPTTESGELKGKLGYVAPEVYRTGGAAVSRAADVYAMGVVLWEVIAGRRLFDEESHAALMHRVLAGRVPALASARSNLTPEVSAQLDAVFARALAVEPEDRYPTAEAFGRELERFAAGTPPRVVAALVRAALPREEGPAPDSVAPHEYVTPVSGPAKRAYGAATIAIAATLVLALFAIAAVRGNAAPTQSAASPSTSTLDPRPSTSTSTSTIALDPRPTAAAAPGSAKGSVGNSTSKVTRPMKVKATTPPRLNPPATSSSVRGRPLFDPEEL